MPAERPQHDRIPALRMPLKYRREPPVRAHQDRSAPAMRKLRVAQRRMKLAHALLEASKHLRRLSAGHIDRMQFAPVPHMQEARAQNQPCTIEQPSPKIGQLYG